MGCICSDDSYDAVPSSSSHPWNILCFGDSLTAGYTNCGTEFHPYSNTLDKLLLEEKSENNFKVVEFGFSGEKVCPTMYNRLRETLTMKGIENSLTYLPFQNIIIILGGTNDLGYNKSTENICKHLKLMYDYCLDSYECQLLVCITIPDINFSDQSKNMKEKRNAVNEFIANYCLESDRILFYDFCSSTMRMSHNEREKYYDKDGLHFSTDGYEYLGAELFKIIQPWAENHTPCMKGCL